MGLSQGRLRRRRSGRRSPSTASNTPCRSIPIRSCSTTTRTCSAKPGLIGDDGLPTGLNGVENFKAALKKLQEAGTKWALSTLTADGNFMFRTIYSLMCQQDGEMLTGDEFLAGDNEEKLDERAAVVSDWTTGGFSPPYTDYPATSRSSPPARRR